MDCQVINLFLFNSMIEVINVIKTNFCLYLVSLAEMFPSSLVLAMEIRDRVVDIVQQRVIKIRAENPGKYDNVACVRVNAMKNLPNWFKKGQVLSVRRVFIY